MKLYIKQKVFTLSESFEVRNEFNETVYYVKGSFFRIPKAFTIYDANQVEVAHIEKHLFRLFPHYDIKIHQGEQLTIKRNFTFFKQSYDLINSNWNLQGDFFSHEYNVMNGFEPIFSLSKHWFTWGDSYELNITDPKQALLSLCIVVTVDAQIEADRQSNN